MRVLLVDADLNALQPLLTDLKSEGFLVDATDTGGDALSLLRHYEFDLVLTSLTLPDMDGAAFISSMRSARHYTPVLGLTRASHVDVRLRALSAGADDVVHRQIELMELVGRMKAIVRRSRGFSQSLIRAGAISLDVDQDTAYAHGTQIQLTRKEFALLRTLMLRKNTVLTKEALMNAIYGGMDEPEPKIIDVFICKIRNKFAEVGMQSVIGTVWGRGYIVRDNAGQSDAKPLTNQPDPGDRLVPNPASLMTIECETVCADRSRACGL